MPLPQRCFSGARRRSRFRATPTALQWSEPCDRGPDHEEPDVDIGFLGMGTMGRPMARNLARAGYDVTVWNRSPGKAADVVDYGASEAPDLADVLHKCCRRRRCRPRNRVPCMSIWPRSARESPVRRKRP
ncbi:NAD(P)-binding domain-containing protein [Prescottella equi]|uniref:NAD(P)-binding domain-containing protein n=1 Tax=Rhodococcus hoagii TaxID=43767 RepID=UPI001E3D5460|nr:NAD(P)-binding domain-containing protein [Prescottella equi]